MKKKRVVDDSPNLEDFEFAEIDKYRLDDEWVLQEKMMGKVGKAVAEAKRELEVAKSRLEVKQALMDKRIRTNPEKYNLSKISETAIASELLLQMDGRPEPQAVIDAKYKVAILQGALDRLSSRGKAISDLIYLHSIEYFAAPKTPRGMKKEDIERMKSDRIPGVRDRNSRSKRKEL